MGGEPRHSPPSSENAEHAEDKTRLGPEEERTLSPSLSTGLRDASMPGSHLCGLRELCGERFRASLGVWVRYKPRRPAWSILYALVPLMGGLLMLEYHASFSPGWRECVHIGIVLFIYGLVWLWLRANAVALLDVGRDTDGRDTAQETSSLAVVSSRQRLAACRAHGRQMRARDTKRAGNTKMNGRGIQRCSRNLSRRSHRWRS